MRESENSGPRYEFLQFVTAGLLQNGMISVKRGADGQAFIAGCGLDVGAAEGRLVEQLAVGDTVERATSGHGEIIARNLPVQVVQLMKKDFFEALLQGKCQIHVALRDFGMRLARFSEQLLHTIRKMASQADRAIGENLHAGIAA